MVISIVLAGFSRWEISISISIVNAAFSQGAPDAGPNDVLRKILVQECNDGSEPEQANDMNGELPCPLTVGGSRLFFCIDRYWKSIGFYTYSGADWNLKEEINDPKNSTSREGEITP